jgi:catechol 2,3-dioxygenase-like lactoylglutathione lyase family enzyme
MTAVAHVGITVPDLGLATQWYRDVLGLEPLTRHFEIRVRQGHAGKVAADVLGTRFDILRQAHLTSANGVALELFEFDTRPRGVDGIFHICLVVDDVPAMAQRIDGAGGRRTSRVWQVFEGEPFLSCYCHDPFGNIIELYSHSHERTYANRDTAL